MKIDVKTLIVLAGIAITFGGFYYGTEYRLSSLEQQVSVIKQENSDVKSLAQKLSKRLKRLEKNKGE
tara:strand:- start:258 stop:458 length:201 start_codon:yes stop_codon:yes gene_type:complete